MFKLFICCLCCMLVGCTTTPRVYDPIEYNHAVSLTVNLTRAIHRCEDPSAGNKEFWSYVQLANTDSFMLTEYVSNRADSKLVIPVVEQTRQLFNDVLNRPVFSPAYCVNKLTNVQAASRIVARALGQTEKFNACQSGIKERYNLFTKSYQAKEISDSEYQELVGDIPKLVAIDSAGCDVVTRAKLLEDLQLIKIAVTAAAAL